MSRQSQSYRLGRRCHSTRLPDNHCLFQSQVLCQSVVDPAVRSCRRPHRVAKSSGRHQSARPCRNMPCVAAFSARTRDVACDASPQSLVSSESPPLRSRGRPTGCGQRPAGPRRRRLADTYHKSPRSSPDNIAVPRRTASMQPMLSADGLMLYVDTNACFGRFQNRLPRMKQSTCECA